MFLLKARHGYREKGNVEGGDVRVGVQINLPAPMTPEQYAPARGRLSAAGTRSGRWKGL